MNGQAKRLAFAVGLAVALAVGGVAAGPDRGPVGSVGTLAERIDLVFQPWNRSDTPGCVVGVAQAGQPVLTRAYGMADLTFGVRLRPDTVFESGSVAKQFTAAAVALLCQAGKLNLEDPVRRHLPELPDFGSPLRIRHLLHHTSGLRCQWPLLNLAGRPTGRVAHTVDEILELVAGMRELNFPPGDEFLYSNTGYTLLGVIVARVSGRSLEDFCREHLFQPLGLRRTRWRDDFTRVVPDLATAYARHPDGTWRVAAPFTDVVGNGGLLTTVEDLLVWNDNLDRPRVGGRELVEQLQTPGRLTDGFETEYAHGLVVTDFRGVREIGHGGSTAGYRAYLARYPEAGLSVAVLSNAADADPRQLVRQVAALYLAGRLREPEHLQVVQPAADLLRRYVGVYREPLTDAVARVTIDPDGASVQFDGRRFLALTPTGFTTADGLRRLTFDAPSERAPARLRDVTRRERPRLWEPAVPFEPTAEELASFTGVYECDEIGARYFLGLDGGRLVARFRPAARLELSPAYADAFEAAGAVFRFTRDDQGRVDGFRVSTGRVRQLRFHRVADAPGG